MKTIGNVLYVTTPDTYLSLDGENIVIRKEEAELKRIPLHNIIGIITFGYTGASPALMGICAERNISLTFLSSHGRFLSRITGKVNGNVLLRREQYRIADSEERSLDIAKNMILAKVFNSKWVLERACRDNGLRIDTAKIKMVSEELSIILNNIKQAKDIEELRGFEGVAAARYFNVFDELIIQQKKAFSFHGRNKRPPLDRVNALLSFIYTLLAHDVASALETIGFDSYVGFMHTDRPGRISLALDLMEEFRAVIADRFVLTLINKKIISADDFYIRENGSVMLNDDARRNVLSAWQSKKNDTLKHPFMDEKVSWGHIPFLQAQLLSRYLRNELDSYPSFLWK